MINAEITPVILCGVSGTRLWPLWRKSFPKQFVPLFDNKNLLQLTLTQAKPDTLLKRHGHQLNVSVE